MSYSTKRLSLTLIILVIMLFSVETSVKLAFSEGAGGRIDLFTQKEPYSGKGSNVSCDAFGPNEKVIIYAEVTYNDYPVAMASVSFEVHGPPNSIQNITLVESAQTNASGMAAISFRIGLVSKVHFGEWIALGTVNVADTILQDCVSFKAGWLVEIVSIRTIDENLDEQHKFSRGDYVGVELALQSIAISNKNATLSVTIYDSLGIPVNSSEINDFTVLPNETVVYHNSFIIIPGNASLGEASISACALTAPPALGGVPYSPKVSCTFFILYRDIAVLEVKPSPSSVYKGETVEIYANVKNKGEETESFDVIFYSNETVIATCSIVDLPPKSSVNVHTVWNTSDVETGFYRISACAEPVPNEVDVSDNFLVNGFVEVKAEPPPPPPPPPPPLPPEIHDITVLAVVRSTSFAYIGESLDVNVTLENNGSEPESFSVIIYYDSNVLGSFFVNDLAVGAVRTHTVHWNTQGVSKGNYTLSVIAAPVPDEENTGDNYFEDGIVRILETPKTYHIPDWLFWLLPLLLVPIIILLIAWLYHRKKKKTEETFYSGWTAWYYCLDLQNRPKKKN